MKNQKGFAAITTLIIVLGVIVLGGVGYVAMNPEVLHAPADKTVKENDSARTGAEENKVPVKNQEPTIAWRFTSAGEVDGMPQTSVNVVVNGKAYDMGNFTGSCSEIGANGGIDGKGLLAGELSAAQCWFAGGGNEIGVFAHEDGGFDIMVGDLSEGEEGSGMFRGDFNIKNTIVI